jgi:hypothetical protein
VSVRRLTGVVLVMAASVLALESGGAGLAEVAATA